MKKLVLSSMFLLLSYSVLASPVLQISPSTRFNFGKYPANIEQRHCFILKNIGSEKLIISKVGVTCGCSAAELFKKELIPGDSTKLYTVIKKESVFGPFSKAFFIHSNAQNGKIQMLTLNGEAIPLITITPSSKIYVGSIPQKQKKEQKFIFTPSAPVELGALNITSDIPVNHNFNSLSRCCRKKNQYPLNVAFPYLLKSQTVGSRLKYCFKGMLSITSSEKKELSDGKKV